VKRLWTIPELIDHWTLTETERALVDASHDPHTRLGCACLLKFFQLDWRFPRRPAEVPAPAVAHLAQQLSLPATVFLRYDWGGRMATHHRTAIRTFLGVREATVADQQAITDWLVAAVLPQTQQAEALRAAFLNRCRTLGLEPPTPNRVERHVRTALATFHEQVCAAVLRRLPADSQAKLEALLLVEPTPDGPVPDASGRSALAELKAEAGPFGVETVRQEAAKLDRIRQLGLSPDVLAGLSPKLLDGFRQRVVAEELHELRRHPTARRLTLLAAYCHRRAQELTDTLAEILIDTIQHIEVRAERRVERALLRDLTRVTGKQTLLFEIAAASLERPDERVRDVIYPIVGEDRLRELVKEYKASGPAYKRKVYTVMRASYSAHYRRLVPIILRALEFRSNNDRHRPVIEALALLKRYVAAPSTQPYFTLGDDVPLDGVVRPAWRDLVVTREDDGQERVNRINYEIAVLHTLRDKLRCKEVWALGADRYRNPDDDLPADFAANRAGYYAALELPTEADAFITGLQRQLTAALTALDADLPTNPAVRLLPKGGGWIALTPADPQPEPVNLDRLKGELGRRWLMIGLRRVAAGDHGQSERDLYYTRRRFITRDGLRAAIARVVNAVFATRRPEIWGEATTACASDSKKFGAFDQNLLTEWHVRYRGPGVMIYWHMDKKAACIFSQLKQCSSSEVAAMITGVIRHCTDMAIDRQFVDSHGQSEIAFTFCNLLGFRLLPRLKALHAQKLYRPEAGQPEAYPHLQPVLTRPIRWELIHQQYDEIVKYVTALRMGTAEAEAILRRFSRANVQHPTYAAMSELGKVYKTLFLCDYLRLPELRREIHEGLNVVENWNSANGFIFYGRGGEFATNQREDAEVAMLCLHLLQLCLVYINTLMIQQVLAEPDWRERLTGEDLRALTPLVYANVNPYGLIRLDMDRRLPLEDEAA
jgi:TnpA family transposase